MIARRRRTRGFRLRPLAAAGAAAAVLCAGTLAGDVPHRSTISAADPGPDAPTAGPHPRDEQQLGTMVVNRRTTIAGKSFTYCGNGSIDQPSSRITRVIVMIHGNDRQACGAAQVVVAASTPEQAARTLVVAPRFPTVDDRIEKAKELHWTFYGWSQGDESLNDGAAVSSYAVVDEIIRRVGVEDRVVAGFSGGGQFVNRYAAGSRIDATRFIIANPSSYLYFTPERPGADPKQLKACPGYDNYRYGVRALNTYMGQSTPTQLTERYGRRRITYLLGDADSDPASASMDKHCGAQAEGRHRFERGSRYWAYLPKVFGPSITERQQMFIVKGVAHDGGGMLVNAAGRKALYG